jgi:membrane protease YdiL (CAAX protease family)
MLTDCHFLAALAAGPAFWLALAVGGASLSGPEWIAGHPGVFVSVVLLYPVAEEIVFRGGVQEVLAKRLPRLAAGPVSSANLATSVLFSATHLLAHPPIWAAGALFPSLLFGHFKERHERLIPPHNAPCLLQRGFLRVLRGFPNQPLRRAWMAV